MRTLLRENAAGTLSLLFAGGLALGFTFAGWDALVLAVGCAGIAVAAPAGFAVGAFFLAGRTFAGCHQIPKAAISTGVAGRCPPSVLQTLLLL